MKGENPGGAAAPEKNIAAAEEEFRAQCGIVAQVRQQRFNPLGTLNRGTSAKSPGDCGTVSSMPPGMCWRRIIEPPLTASADIVIAANV